MLHSWICSLTAASTVAALAKQLTPDGGVRKVTELLCGVMLSVTLLGPVMSADLPSLAFSMSEYRRTTAELTQDAQAAGNQLLRQCMEEQCAAYVLSKAHTLGIEDLRVAVKTQWRDEYWVPYEAQLKGKLSTEDRYRLAAYMEAELGIPGERQYWNE